MGKSSGCGKVAKASNMIGEQIQIGIEEGCKVLPFTLAFCFAFRLVKFPDLGITSILTLGGACFVMLANAKVPITVCLIVATFSGLVGACTNGILFIRLRVQPLLSSILTMFLLYGVALLVLNRQATVTLQSKVKFTEWHCGGVAVLLSLVLAIFLASKRGLKLRFAGEKPILLSQIGIDPRKSYFVMMCLGGLLAALAGAMLCGVDGGVSINKGKDYLFSAMIALIIGEGICTMIASGWIAITPRISGFLPHWLLTGVHVLWSCLSGTSAAVALSAARVGGIMERVIYQLTVFYWKADVFTNAATGVLAAGLLLFSRVFSRKRRFVSDWNFHDRIG